ANESVPRAILTTALVPHTPNGAPFLEFSLVVSIAKYAATGAPTGGLVPLNAGSPTRTENAALLPEVTDVGSVRMDNRPLSRRSQMAVLFGIDVGRPGASVGGATTTQPGPAQFLIVESI